MVVIYMILKKSETKKDMKGRAAAGVAGAVIGAGVAVAATKVLSDKKNQEKLKKTLRTAHKQVKSGVKSLQDKAATMHKDTSKNLEKMQQEAKKLIAKSESTPRSVRQTSTTAKN
jgi:hypothetical protein